MSEEEGPDRAQAREDQSARALELEAILELYSKEAVTSLGRRLLRELAPRSAEDARAALRRARACVQLEARDARVPLVGLLDLAPIFARGLRGFDEEALAALRELIEARGRILAWCQEFPQHATPLVEVLSLAPPLLDLRQEIDRLLDDRGKLREDASPLLQRLTRDAQTLRGEIERQLKEIVKDPIVRGALSDLSVHRRQGRPTLVVRARLAGRVRGLVHDRSASGESVFIEPADLVAPGNRLVELESDLRRETERLLVGLGQKVLARAREVRHLERALGEIELAVIGARFIGRHGGTMALQPGDPGACAGLHLKGARHPLLIEQLQEGRIPEVVPIDLVVGEHYDMLLITGPNTGGKTLALKTAGVFALLTRLGLPVPSLEGTTVPLFEKVLADIGDEQEIRQNLSTFASHLKRLKGILERATKADLVLLDELGGGTDPEQGGALGIALLEALLARRVPTLVTTHLGRLKEFAWRRARIENASTSFDLATLEPLYRISMGTPGESGALSIARRLGLPEQVVRRAEECMERSGEDLESLFGEVRSARAEAELVRRRTEEERDRARSEAQRLGEAREQLEQRSAQVEAEAQRGLEERVRSAQASLERALALLPQVAGDARRALQTVLEDLGRDLSGATMTERRQEFLRGLRRGALVYLPRHKKRVQVVRVDFAKGEIHCRLGKVELRVALDDVTPFDSL